MRIVCRPPVCDGAYGERDGTRTHDHLIKSQVLYQLSYALVTQGA